MKTRADHELAYSLSATEVDTVNGVISGATAAKSGVRAKGKFVLLDAAGIITKNPALAVTKIPAFTDDKTLETLMGAAQDAGGRVRVRSDHDESLSARAGFATNFRRIDDRVVVDLHLNKSYRDRATVLETTQKTPDLIGCSIDFVPSFEIIAGKAFMRAETLTAVDIVDEGAITPMGMFMKRSVDSESEEASLTETISPLTTMAKTDDKKTPPTVEECMAMLSEHAAKLAEFTATLTSMKAAPAPVTLAAVDELKVTLAAIKEQNVQLAAAQAKFVTEQTEKLTLIAKTNAALGLKAGIAAVLTGSPEEEAERVRLAAEKEADAKKPKTFLALVEAKKAEGKLQASECHRYVMNAHPEAYQAHLEKLGVVKSAA